MVILEGLHPLKHALRFGALVERAVARDPARVVALARELAPDVADRVAELLEPGDSGEFDVVAWAPRPRSQRQRHHGPAILLDHPRHLGNVGAAIRVAAAADASRVFVLGDADPWHPAAIRGAAGLQFALPVARVDEVPDVAPGPLIGLDPAGENKLGILPRNATLAFGSERRGLSPDVRARVEMLVALPMRERVSSLNLATSVSAALYVLRRAKGGW